MVHSLQHHNINFYLSRKILKIDSIIYPPFKICDIILKKATYKILFLSLWNFIVVLQTNILLLLISPSKKYNNPKLLSTKAITSKYIISNSSFNFSTTPYTIHFNLLQFLLICFVSIQFVVFLL